MARFKLSNKVLSESPPFLDALDQLSEDSSLSIKDRYALARTRRDVVDAAKDYEKLRGDLIKKYGKPEAELLKKELDELPSDSPAREGYAARIKMAEMQENYRIEPSDKEGFEKFKTEVEELQDIEFEIFLDHKIVLTEGCKLSGKSMSVLLDLVEVKE